MSHSSAPGWSSGAQTTERCSVGAVRSGEDLRVGDRLGRYRLVRELGRGSMGMVFLAEDTMLRTPICVKVLHPALADHPEAAERFNREIVLARRISHRGVCRLHDIHQDGNLRFITMEYVEGQPLRDLLQAESPALTLEQVATIGATMCDALAAAHDVGVVHRDLKPRNIMVRPNGEAAILDFGIATALDGASSLTMPGIALGTKHYIAPEVWAGRPATPLADQFAVGVILFNCLTRRMPFNAARDMMLLDEMSKGPAPPPSAFRPDVPAAMDAVVRRALSFKPEARFPDVRALRDALVQVGGAAWPLRSGTTAPPGVGSASSPEPVTGMLPPTLPSVQAPTLPLTELRSPSSPATAFEPTMVAPMPMDGPATVPASVVTGSGMVAGAGAAAAWGGATTPLAALPSSRGFVPSQPDHLPPSDASWVISGRAVNLPAIPKAVENVPAPVVRGIADMMEPEQPARRRSTPMLVAVILLGGAAIAGAIVVAGQRRGVEPAPDAGVAAQAPLAPSPPVPHAEPPPPNADPPPPATGSPPPGANLASPPPAAGPPAAVDAPDDDVDDDGTATAPRERRAKKPADPDRQRYGEAKAEVARAMTERGLLAGDDPELDRLRLRGSQEAAQKSFGAAARSLADAKARVAAVAIDRGFVDRKLARFNSAFDRVTDPARRAAADAAAAEVMTALGDKRYPDANDSLNRAFALVR